MNAEKKHVLSRKNSQTVSPGLMKFVQLCLSGILRKTLLFSTPNVKSFMGYGVKNK